MITQHDLNKNPVYLLKTEYGWSLERIAEEMDYSVSAVTKWSSGARNPSPRATKAALQVLERNK